MSKKVIVKPIRTTKAEPKLLGLRSIALDKIRESENPIRSKYTKIEELAQSLETYGLIHPPLVMPINDPDFDYEIVAGNRRLRALRQTGEFNATFMVLQDGISDFDAMFYTGIENIQIEYVDRIDRGKWLLALQDMEDPRTGEKPTIAEISKRTGIEEPTLYAWREAARTASNLEAAAREMTESTKTFLAEIIDSKKNNKQTYLLSLPEKLGIEKLREIQRIAKSTEETAELGAIVDYKKLDHSETKRFIKILREHPDRDPFEVATEVKGTRLILQLSHKVRNALVKYATDRNMLTENGAITILEQVLKKEGYL